MHLPALRSNATELAGGPWFSYRPDKKPVLAAGLQQGVIGGREMTGLRKDAMGVKRQQTHRQSTVGDSPHSGGIQLLFLRFSATFLSP